MIHVKILSLGAPERYAVRRMVIAAQNKFEGVDLSVQIREVSDASEIGRYASVLVLPTLVINEEVVCTGRFPTREEIVGWLSKAL